jgi:hypothetical protein
MIIFTQKPYSLFTLFASYIILGGSQFPPDLGIT